MEPRLVATLYFTWFMDPPRQPAYPTVLRGDEVRAIARALVTASQRAERGPIFAAEYHDDGSWRSGIPSVADLLNAHFGPETRHRTFPMLPLDPTSNVARAVATLFSARVDWAPGWRDPLPEEDRRHTTG